MIPTLNSLDLFCLGAFVLFAGFGAWKGLVRTLFQMASWVAGALGGFLATSFIAPLLQANITGVPGFGLVLFSGFIGFVVCFLGIRILGKILNGMVSKSALGGLNRLGGAAIGGVKAAILVGLILFVLEVLPVQGNLAELRGHSVAFKAWTTLRASK
jgi:membrane protein required for colicin V production